LEFYGNAIGDIALRTLSYSGIYLVGGISITIAPYILKYRNKFMVIYLGIILNY